MLCRTPMMVILLGEDRNRKQIVEKGIYLASLNMFVPARQDYMMKAYLQKLFLLLCDMYIKEQRNWN